MHISTFVDSVGISAPAWVYFTLFLISFLDTLIAIGAFFPASFFVIAAGYFIFRGHLDIFLAFAAILVGGVLGDLLSYYFGHKGKSWLNSKPRLKRALFLHKGEEFFFKYGNKSIIFGRFLGILKSVIPFIAGLTKMNFKKFLYLNVLSGIIWTVVHLGIGYLLGKLFSYFYIPRHIKFLIIFLPFLLFLIFILFESRKSIAGMFKKKDKNSKLELIQ